MKAGASYSLGYCSFRNNKTQTTPATPATTITTSKTKTEQQQVMLNAFWAWFSVCQAPYVGVLCNHWHNRWNAARLYVWPARGCTILVYTFLREVNTCSRVVLYLVLFLLFVLFELLSQRLSVCSYYKTKCLHTYTTQMQVVIQPCLLCCISDT